MQLCIFNPEHDLCLGNGRAHYMPPRSAILFARQCAHLMSYLYPSALSLSIHDLPCTSRFHRDPTPSLITPWGWNATLKQQLLDRGIPATLLPTDEALATLRRLQHRATLLPLQPDCQAFSSPDSLLDFTHSSHGSSFVLKAPWSGAGRGQRRINSDPTPNDLAWIAKVIRNQQCVILQPLYNVADDFALLYRIEGHTLHFVGYSLFQATHGVYSGNILLHDREIQQRIVLPTQKQEEVESWMLTNLIGQYEGHLGIDFLRTADGEIYVGELNLRHTMGHVAHAYLEQHPEAHGTLFNPTYSLFS